MLQLLMIIFGVTALKKGEFKITNSRKVYEPHGRILGAILLFGGISGCGSTVDILPIIPFSLIFIIAFFVTLIMGLVVAKPLNHMSKNERKAKRKSKPDWMSEED